MTTYTYITCIYSFLSLQLTYRSSQEICSIEKAVFKNFAISTGKHLCWSLFLIKLQACLQRTFTTDVSCEYCESFKNTYFEEHMWTAAPKLRITSSRRSILFIKFEKNVLLSLFTNFSILRKPRSIFQKWFWF